METTWQFYTTVPSAWAAMLDDIAQARNYIELDQYIFEPDQIGRQFIELLKVKARQGIRVRIICDAVGSSRLYGSDIPAQLSEAGVQIYFYNPISPWRIHNFTSWFYRDHKKILVVDGTVAHIGGVGINDRMSPWRDTQVRLAGPVVAEIDRIFRKMLDVARQRKFAVIPNQLSDREFQFITSSPYLRNIRSFRSRQRHLRDLLLRRIRQACLRIYLTTPYFVPDFRLFRALRQAARRGVDVRLIVPARSDVRPVDIASSSYFGLALGAGIKIYRYEGGLLHAKTAVIDNWSTIGSANLDNLSFWFHYEGNLVCTNPAFTAELQEHFNRDLLNCREVKLFDWQQRPWRQKVLEIISWPTHGFL